MADGEERSPFNPKLVWKLGLIANNGKYLTTEKIGNLVHPSGNDMRKNQIWLLDPFADYVHLKAPNGKYLTAGQKGQLVTEKKEDPGTDEQWTITALDDGRWTIKSAFGYFLSMDDNKPEDPLNSFSRSGDNEKSKFTVHLAIHPQVVMRNNKRNSYCHLEKDQLAVTEKIPWGVDALLTLGYHAGKYSIRSSSNQYVTAAGELKDAVSAESQFILVVMNDQVAFKSNKGKYLQTSGGSGKLHVKQNEITENELFCFEDSHPQATLRSFSSQKHLVTWKQGTDVKAIHEQGASDKEIFQFEVDRAADGNPAKPARWSIRNCQGAYLTVVENSLYTSETQQRDEHSWFEMSWLGDCCAFKSSNGRYLRRDPNGAITAKADDISDNAKFFFNLDNRPQIVLRGDFGFLAVRSVQGKDLVTCNNPIGDVFLMTCKDGNYSLQATNGKYLKLESDGTISASDSSANESFHLSLIVHSKMAIKAAATGKYLKGEQNGGFKANSNSIGANELWEF